MFFFLLFFDESTQFYTPFPKHVAAATALSSCISAFLMAEFSMCFNRVRANHFGIGPFGLCLHEDDDPLGLHRGIGRGKMRSIRGGDE